jgi:hypothetical protein
MKYTLALFSLFVLSTVLYANKDEALYEIKTIERPTVIAECGTEFDKYEYELQTGNN